MVTSSASKIAWLTSRRDVADKFPDAEVIGIPPNNHSIIFCIDSSNQEPIFPQPSGQPQPKTSTLRSTTAAANGSTLPTTSTTSMSGSSMLALLTGPPSTKNVLSEHNPL